jgi:hypothetical protein
LVDVHDPQHPLGIDIGLAFGLSGSALLSRALPFGSARLMQLRANHSNTSAEVVLRLSIVK